MIPSFWEGLALATGGSLQILGHFFRGRSCESPAPRLPPLGDPHTQSDQGLASLGE